MALGGESIWVATTPDTSYPQLPGDVEVDVAVVGAGITGITAAILLKRAGKRVALLDSKRIVRGATGYTTAKVTSGHGVVYGRLTDTFGEDGRAHLRRVEPGRDRADRRAAREAGGIDCDFERKDNYVIAESERGARAGSSRRRRRCASWACRPPS